MTTPSWDAAYAGSVPPPWDVGQPQPAFVRLAEQGLLAALSSADALGVDVSPLALEQARGKAAARGIKARFEVADALSLGDLGVSFDTVIDSGLFHVFDDDNRARYVASLASVLRPGGHLYLMCFSDRQPGAFGPRRVSQDELRTAFRGGWTVLAIQAESFALNPGVFGTATAQAWLATVRRLPPPAED